MWKQKRSDPLKREESHPSQKLRGRAPAKSKATAEGGSERPKQIPHAIRKRRGRFGMTAKGEGKRRNSRSFDCATPTAGALRSG
jgi:hypothetical protein